MQAWTPLPYYGCVNNGSAYQEVAFARARALIDAGADVIQHDDPTVNSEAASWNNGDPEQSGCYCSVCMAGFTTALLDGSLDANTTALGVNGSFNYKNYLLDEMSAAPTRETEDARLLEPTSNASQELRELFLLYQQNVTNSYARKLRDHVNNYSAHVRNRSVFPMSCNNGGRWPQPPESSPYFAAPIFRADGSRRRRGCHVDIPWRRVAATPGPRGRSAETVACLGTRSSITRWESWPLSMAIQEGCARFSWIQCRKIIRKS